tara:strand:+ start:26433 stop:26984 length:552 start_codon:yes stop_codon:yes gene_type:complete
MTVDLDKVVSVLNRVCDTMDTTNGTMETSLERLERYRDGVKGDVSLGAGAVDKASDAMNTSAEAMLAAIDTLRAMQERHSQDVDKLGNKIDKHTEAVVLFLGDLSGMVAQQEGMNKGIEKILAKIDDIDDHSRSLDTRITTIEASRDAVKDTSKDHKDNTQKTIAIVISFLGALVAILAFLKL